MDDSLQASGYRKERIEIKIDCEFVLIIQRRREIGCERDSEVTEVISELRYWIEHHIFPFPVHISNDSVQKALT